MRNIVILFVAMSCMEAGAASAYWTGIDLISNGKPNGTGSYDLYCNDISGADGHGTWILSDMYGHMENGNLYMKHKDFSKEMMDPTFNWWAIVTYGEIVNEATFHDATKQVELFWGDAEYASISGTLVENPDDFYMAFKASEVLVDDDKYVEGRTWYGWVHVSVDENDLTMTLLGSGINLEGGAVTVGAIPEPSSALLLLVGGAVLGLRRRRRGHHD